MAKVQKKASDYQTQASAKTLENSTTMAFFQGGQRLSEMPATISDSDRFPWAKKSEKIGEKIGEKYPEKIGKNPKSQKNGKNPEKSRAKYRGKHRKTGLYFAPCGTFSGLAMCFLIRGLSSLYGACVPPGTGVCFQGIKKPP